MSWTIPVLLAASTLLGACDDVTGPQGASCGPPPYFTQLPVAENDLDVISVFGGLGAPGHTLPTAHGGMFLTRENVTLRSPGDLAVTELRRVRYVQSPTRQGLEDYAIFFQVCKEMTGWFGHVISLAPVFSPSSIEWSSCQTYSTSDETVEACDVASLDIKVSVGDELGTGGFSAELGFLAVDFGMLDDRVENFYVSPERFPDPTFHAVCMWEQFDAANQAILFSKLLDLARPDLTPAGEPRCGTMEVDVAGTAKGVWAETGVTNLDETRYITLANYPYRPQDHLALSLGPATLGARVAIVPRQTTGRVNRAFEQVMTLGQIYCYGPDVGFLSPASWFVSLTSTTALQIERRDHAAGASPCNDDPSTWSFGANALALVR